MLALWRPYLESPTEMGEIDFGMPAVPVSLPPRYGVLRAASPMRRDALTFRTLSDAVEHAQRNFADPVVVFNRHGVVARYEDGRWTAYTVG